MPTIPAQLLSLKQELADKKAAEPLPARELLAWFKAERRSPIINAYIRAALAELGIVTEPDFETVNIDAPLVFKLAPRTIDPTSTFENGTANARQASASLAAEAMLAQVTPSRQDPTLRIKILDAAIRSPVVVTPDATLTRATTLMLSKDFSQLPVLSNHKIRGAISWRSLGKRLALGASRGMVKDFLEDPVEIRADTPLLQAIALITQYDYALIVDESRRLLGLVTTADVSLQFQTLSEPFLLLREAENYIRNLLSSCYSIEQLKQFRDPNIHRDVSSVADLSLGEYLRALGQDDTWSKLKLPVDRRLFVESLDQIRSIRNDVMHFDPDPIEPKRLATLVEFVRLLQALGDHTLESMT